VATVLGGLRDILFLAMSFPLAAAGAA